MKIEKNVDGANTSFALEGRLDTMTAPLLESEIQGKLDGVTELEFDFAHSAISKAILDLPKSAPLQSHWNCDFANPYSAILKAIRNSASGESQNEFGFGGLSWKKCLRSLPTILARNLPIWCAISMNPAAWKTALPMQCVSGTVCNHEMNLKFCVVII